LREMRRRRSALALSRMCVSCTRVRVSARDGGREWPAGPRDSGSPIRRRHK
jgi:hypothetical protein